MYPLIDHSIIIELVTYIVIVFSTGGVTSSSPEENVSHNCNTIFFYKRRLYGTVRILLDSCLCMRNAFCSINFGLDSVKNL